MGFPLIENRVVSAANEIQNVANVVDIAYPRQGFLARGSTANFALKDMNVSGARYNKILEFPTDVAGDDYNTSATVGPHFNDVGIGGVSSGTLPANITDEDIYLESSRFLKPTIGTNTSVGDYSISLTDNRLHVIEVNAKAQTAGATIIITDQDESWKWSWFTAATGDPNTYLNYDKEIILKPRDYISTGSKFNSYKVRKIWCSTLGINNTFTNTSTSETAMCYQFASRVATITPNIPQLTKINLTSSTLSPTYAANALNETMDIPTPYATTTSTSNVEIFRIDLASTATMGIEFCYKLGMKVSATGTDYVTWEFSGDGGSTWSARNGAGITTSDFSTGSTTEVINYDRVILFDKVTNMRLMERTSVTTITGSCRIYLAKTFDLAPAIFTPTTYAGPASSACFDRDLTTASTQISTQLTDATATGFLLASWDMGTGHYNRGVNENGYISKPLIKALHTATGSGRIYFWGSPDNSTWYTCGVTNSNNQINFDTGTNIMYHGGAYNFSNFYQYPGQMLYRYGRCTLYSSSGTVTQYVNVYEIGFLF